MNCPNCNKEVLADRLFCNWCEVFIPKPSVGKKTGLFGRWFATFIDPIIALILYLMVKAIFGKAEGTSVNTPTIVMIIVVLVAYGGFFFWLLSKGTTPGKWLIGVNVVGKLDGNYPGLWRMILREIVGKFVSGLFLGFGYFWAIWDKDSQSWHDKIAGTVVVRIEKPILLSRMLIGATFVVFIASVSFLGYLKRLHRSMAYFQTVGEYVQQGKLDDAITILKDTLSKNQRIAEAHAALGMIYNKKDMLDEALSELKTALNIKPDLINVYQEMYLIYKKKGMEEEAKSALNSYEKLKVSR